MILSKGKWDKYHLRRNMIGKYYVDLDVFDGTIFLGIATLQANTIYDKAENI
eukprot:TRINITY_DN1247_c0_g1_i1.p7 TRINITY_DN1247_c0_g1~~TRINITY_DN1247_c0_g1_i1.p7  ORF type:complete len:52 (+),score=6.12 TRINITY_DN1247_c0_g1_i1:774-929(+)